MAKFSCKIDDMVSEINILKKIGAKVSENLVKILDYEVCVLTNFEDNE